MRSMVETCLPGSPEIVGHSVVQPVAAVSIAVFIGSFTVSSGTVQRDTVGIDTVGSAMVATGGFPPARPPLDAYDVIPPEVRPTRKETTTHVLGRATHIHANKLSAVTTPTTGNNAAIGDDKFQNRQSDR